VRSKLIIGIAIAVAVLLFLSISIEVTSKPSFCRTCHEMKNDYNSWNSSKHAMITCNACHVGSGMFKLVIHKAGSLVHELPMHYLRSEGQIINEKSEVSINLPSENCLECHVMPKEKYFKNLIFVHAKHKKQKCAYCHNRIAHPNLKEHKSRATMTFCVNCHKKNNEPTHCLFCHTPSIMQKPPTHKTDDWVPQTHKTNVDAGCTFCHKRNFCQTCHQKIRE
jgi:cytochrome c nitrite reductase small subunit